MEQPQSLIVFLAEIEDTRKAKGRRHEQLSMLVIMIMAMLCGKTSLKSIARFAKTHRVDLAQHMPLPRGKAPSYSTIQRTSLRLKIDGVCSAFNKWMSQYIKPEPTAIDGKSITSTVNTETGKQVFTSLVSFFGQKSQLIYQIGVLENDKRSEIHVVQEILKVMQIEKAIFTLDALHCQKKTTKEIVESGNGYVITVKRNQPSLYQAIAAKTAIKPLGAYSWKQTGHGHDAQCRIKIWEADEDMKLKWPGLERYISVRRYGVREGEEFDTVTFYIASEILSAWCFAQLIRYHRKIENTLHWTKDVVLNEDDCGLINSQQAANMAVVRNMSFNLHVMNGYKSLSEGISAMGEKVGMLWNLIKSQ